MTSKNGKASKNFKFLIGSVELEYVKQYKYLGVMFSNNGKFFVGEKNLSMKANRALFPIKQTSFEKSIKPLAVLKMFDALVKPIALYNSEVWG